MRRRNLKVAIKETKNTLHQIAGAYLESTPPYTKWREAMADAGQSSEEWKRLLRGMMPYHASTRERLPSLETFYTTTLADIQPVRSVLDLACGLNPLAIPWMPLAEGFSYYAYDLYTDMMAFLNDYLAKATPYSEAQACDVAVSPPARSVHVAYVLKFLPLLEQLAKEETLPWLRNIQAEYLLVSFPTRTLGGRDVHMAANYEARFREAIQETGWEMQRFAFPNELCFLIKTTLAGG
jgi:16S rRNA (guanine(1405)-N(7))-methyltransferase